MHKRKKVLITGAGGLCASALRRLYPEYCDLYEFIYSARKVSDNHDEYICDLKEKDQVKLLFEKTQPDYVVHTAAFVGGIGGNLKSPSKYFYDNILMNTYVIDFAYRFGVEKLIAFSSICAFPNDLVLLEEDRMHDGPVWPDNEAYGFAKRAVDIQIRSLKKEKNVSNYCSIIPGNIAGINDLYSLVHGHVLPMLIHKLYLAKRDNEPFEVWGDGKSLREFLFADDVAKCVLELLGRDDIPERLIISGEREYSIKEIVDKLVKIADFRGEVKWLTDKPNGQRSRPSSKELFRHYFPSFKFTPMDEWLKLSWDWFVENYPNVRM